MAPPCRQIKVKTLTGKEIEIDIEADDTIARIKERVEVRAPTRPPPTQLPALEAVVIPGALAAEAPHEAKTRAPPA